MKKIKKIRKIKKYIALILICMMLTVTMSGSSVYADNDFAHLITSTNAEDDKQSCHDKKKSGCQMITSEHRRS